MEEQNLTNNSLTLSEEKLIEVLTNPENRMKSITDICKIAKISRTTYYESFSKKYFRDEYNKRSKELVKQSVGSVINTFIKEAQRGSFQHGKVLLEMANMYTEKVESNNKNDSTIRIKLEGDLKEWSK